MSIFADTPSQASENFVDDSSAKVSLDNLRGHTSIITFAYANCRKTCVESLHVMQRLQKEAKAKHQDVEFVVVSYDPDNDTPEVWREYRKQHKLTNTNWHFWSGPPETTQKLAQYLGIKYWRYDDHVMHDFTIAMLNPTGTVIKTMNWDQRNDSWFY